MTGEPDAGNPPVRFGGRGDRNKSGLPYPYQKTGGRASRPLRRRRWKENDLQESFHAKYPTIFAIFSLPDKNGHTPKLRMEQAVCIPTCGAGRISIIQPPAEQLSWLHWMNIFTTKAQSHEAVPATAARPRVLKNTWPAGPRTSCPPVAVAIRPFHPLTPV